MDRSFSRAIPINPGYGSAGFSKAEIKHIAVSCLVLSLAFTIIFGRNIGFFSTNVVLNTVCWFLVSVLLITFSFLLHELGHKFVAQKYGAWAEFRSYPFGLVMALVFSLFGFLFAAPGAVYINGRITEKQNGLISVAGPLTNMILGAIFIAISLVVSNTLISVILYLFAYINVFLALFNLIPIPPLDGQKILAWNVPVYIIMIACAVLMFVYVWI